jgi:hypothetical protein
MSSILGHIMGSIMGLVCAQDVPHDVPYSSSHDGPPYVPMDLTLAYRDSYISQFGSQNGHLGNPIGQLNYYLGRGGSHTWPVVGPTMHNILGSRMGSSMGQLCAS